MRLSKTVDSSQGRLDSNVQSTMSRMPRELMHLEQIVEPLAPLKPGLHDRHKLSIYDKMSKKKSQERSIFRTDNDRDYILHVTT